MEIRLRKDEKQCISDLVFMILEHHHHLALSYWMEGPTPTITTTVLLMYREGEYPQQLRKRRRQAIHHAAHSTAKDHTQDAH